MRQARAPEVSPATGVRGCGGKRAYESFTVAERMAKRTNRGREDAHVEAYHCRHCNHFHVGENTRYAQRRSHMRTIATMFLLVLAACGGGDFANDERKDFDPPRREHSK
jgi:hypothetical protein